MKVILKQDVANLGGAVHNAARSRVPVFVFAGLTPYTLEGELPGSRNSFVNHLQDVPDQHGIVRPYVKWSYDIRTAAILTDIPCITTIQGLGAAVQGMEAMRRGEIGVRSLQDWARARIGD